jgi:hypothetical protein
MPTGDAIECVGRYLQPIDQCVARRMGRRRHHRFTTFPAGAKDGAELFEILSQFVAALCSEARFNCLGQFA